MNFTIDQEISKVFWASIATANWNGIAMIDIDEHTLVYQEKFRNDTKSVTVNCISKEKKQTEVEITVGVKEDKPHHATCKQIYEKIKTALDWKQEQWNKLYDAPELVDATYNLSLDINADTENDIFINGIKIAGPNSNLTVTNGLYSIKANNIESHKVLNSVNCIVSAFNDGLPNLVVFATAMVVLPPIKIPPILTNPGTSILGRGVGLVLGRVVIVAGAVMGAIEIAKDIKITIDIIDITDDNDKNAQSCCCLWSRLEAYTDDVLMSDGTTGQGIEIYNRGYSKTVPNTKAGCAPGFPPVFPPVTVTSTHLFQGTKITLPGGPATSGPRCFAGTKCPTPEGFKPPVFRDDVVIRRVP